MCFRAVKLTSFSLVMGWVTLAHAQQPLPSITMRASQALPTAVQSVLTELAKSVKRDVPPGVDPFSVLRSHCGGSFTNDYYADARSANPDFAFASASKPRVLELPACLKIGKNATVNVAAGDTLESITERNLGVQPDEPISLCDVSSPQTK